MKIQETVRRETLNIAAGTLAMTGVLLLVFTIAGYMDWTVILGALLGAAAGVLDFFLLGLTVQKAAQMQAALPPQPRGEDGEEPPQTPEQREVSARIRRTVQLSHTGRTFMLVGFAALGLLPCVNLYAIVIPLLFPKIVIYILNFFRGRGKEA